MNKQTLILVLVSMSVIMAADPNGKLLQVVETFRHGARYRIYGDSFVDQDPNAAVNYGELTGEGQRMHYVLGKTLQTKYAASLNFPTTYDHTFIHAKSTNVNRTIMSAYSQLAGMFPLNKGIDVSAVNQQFLIPPFPNLYNTPGDLNFALDGGQQPIPIHVKEEKDEKQLLGYMNACVNAAAWSKANKDDADWNRIKGEFQDVFDALAKENDYFKLIPNPDLDDVSHLVDTLIAQKWLGDVAVNNDIALHLDGFLLTLEEMMLPVNFNRLWVQMNLLYTIQLHLALFKTPQQKQTTVTPYFNELLAYFNNYIANPKTYFKWIMLSAHDTTIAMVSQGMNFTSWECMEQVKLGKQPANQPCMYTYPGFASNIIFELYEDVQQKPYIKALYNGTAQALCGTQDTYCYLDKFTEIIQGVVVSNFDSECGNPVYTSASTDSSTPTWAIVVIVIVSVLLAAALAFVYIQRRKINSLSSVDKASNYSHI